MSIESSDLWDMGSREQLEEWLKLAEESRAAVPVLRGLSLREILAAQRYEFLDARMIGEEA